MNSLKFLSALQKRRLTFVETADVALLLKISKHSAGKYLEALREQKLIEKVSRGKWALVGSDFDPLQIAEFLTAPFESYISLNSALFHHGMIEQVPTRIYAMTVGRTRLTKTPFGQFSFHKCNPCFFVGYVYHKPFLNIATPEKALIDFFYYSSTKSREFTKLPEIELPKDFSWRKAQAFCAQIPSPRSASLAKSRLAELRLRMGSHRTL